MKRKLDSNDVPVPTDGEQNDIEHDSFLGLGLDARLMLGIAKQNFRRPTLVQARGIPLALAGKDVLARAKTGSGKTAAYLLPILQSILKRKEAYPSPCTHALILAPTRELTDQIHKAVDAFTAFCAKDIRAVNLSQRVSNAVQRFLLADSPDIVIATPARALTNLNVSALSLENIVHLVIDEADLVLSYGYKEDLQNIARFIPKGVQTILMSATLSSDVDTLAGLFCRDPVMLNLEEKETEGDGLNQYVVKCAEDEKFLLIYVIFKLKLVKGKCIIFVGDVDRCYRLKLYLEQFGTKSCILNSELPVNSRLHVVEEFNKNVYDIIIASDEYEVLGDEDKQENGFNSREAKASDVVREAEPPKKEDREAAMDEDCQAVQPPKKKRKALKRDKEYGVSRGIDFKNVACVINFDLPVSSTSYTHRIGRTARAGKTGMALSFVVPADLYRKHKPTSIESAKNDELVLAKIIKDQAKIGKEVKPYNFDMKQVQPFRYRMGDALRAVTRIAIREARTRELRQELMKSEKLKRHFEENPRDLQHLRHDGELRPARVQAHMKHVPGYLLPKEGKRAIAYETDLINKQREHGTRMERSYKANSKGRRDLGRKANPLRTFRSKPRVQK